MQSLVGPHRGASLLAVEPGCFLPGAHGERGPGVAETREPDQGIGSHAGMLVLTGRGFGISACNYLAKRKIILWGGDTWGTEAVGPGFAGENEQPFQCHIQMMPRYGIWNLENMQFSELLADNVSEFLFVWSPLKIKGATGSPGNPVAIY